MNYEDLAQPEWAFIEDLVRPLHTAMPAGWGEEKEARETYADLSHGVYVKESFADPTGTLETAYEDFNRFLTIGGLRETPPGEAYRIETCYADMPTREAYRIEVGKAGCRLSASDSEGIRRGLVHVEDEMLRANGPYLPLGVIERKPLIRTRISRCFFAPTNRYPNYRVELADDEDYYPEQYLNKLAHEGINGLWLTIDFRETIPSKLFPKFAPDAARRLAKLRRTVEKCKRYGIKIYIFCIEPRAFSQNDPMLAAYPELDSLLTIHSEIEEDYTPFCTGTETGIAYVEEAVHTLFAEVPDLGGLINITVGERWTHCFNAYLNNGHAIQCPRCRTKDPHQGLKEVLAAMERGMHAAAPDAELISWPYGQLIMWDHELMVESAAHLPENVILQHNFETGGKRLQLGKWRDVYDYWLSYIGPSDAFRESAERATAKGNRIFAKLQVGCSWEVSTVPYVPVPGNLYRKYAEMHKLGVSGVMQCWLIGSYFGLMNKVAGELSFAPFDETEGEFLKRIAMRDWGKDADLVCEAWALMQEGYNHYPLSNMFGYYGPMHDGPVWPLYLIPRDIGLVQAWRVDFPPHGDRIGECVLYTHTLEEICELTARLARLWREGAGRMESLADRYSSNYERKHDIAIIKALRLQFESGNNIMQFYKLREELIGRKTSSPQALLDQMEEIVRREIGISEELLELSEADPRLGFQSEAEAYKYYPDKLRWRAGELEKLLQAEFPLVRRQVEEGLRLFPGFTGEEPEGPVYRAQAVRGHKDDSWLDANPEQHQWGQAPWEAVVHEDGRLDPNTAWKAVHDGNSIYFAVKCKKSSSHHAEKLEFSIEPKRLWPSVVGIVDFQGAAVYGHMCNYGLSGCYRRSCNWKVAVEEYGETAYIKVEVPMEELKHFGYEETLQAGDSRRPIRFNLRRKGAENSRWIYKAAPKHRLVFNYENHDELGWLLLE